MTEEHPQKHDPKQTAKRVQETMNGFTSVILLVSDVTRQEIYRARINGLFSLIRECSCLTTDQIEAFWVALIKLACEEAVARTTRNSSLGFLQNSHAETAGQRIEARRVFSE